jgi:hypothetical protein
MIVDAWSPKCMWRPASSIAVILLLLTGGLAFYLQAGEHDQGARVSINESESLASTHGVYPALARSR